MVWPQGRPLVPNPTGKGGFKPGHSGFDTGKATSAGKRLSEMLGEAILANNAEAIRKNLNAIITKFRNGDEWATGFVWDRTVGKPIQAIVGENGGPLQIALIERVIIDPLPANSNG